MSPTNREPGVVKLARHLRGGLAWADHHFLLAAALFTATVIAWTLLKAYRRKVRRARLAKTAHERNIATKIGHRIGWKTGERFITWPRDPHAAGAPVVIRYPPQFTALEREVAFIPEVITSLVGGVWDPAHDHSHHRLRYIRRPPESKLPTTLEYPDDDSWPIDRIPLAVDTNGNWIEADLTSESPHLLVAGKTRTGKTSTMTIPIAHIASRGGLVDVLDPKRVGYQKSFKGLHNVRVHTELSDMVQTVEDFCTEMRSRYEYLESGREDNGPTRLLVIDEMGTFMSMVKSRGQAAPTLEQYRLILWQGGQADFHLIVGAQQASSVVMGGTDSRESFALRIGTGAPSKRGGPLLFGTDELPQVDPTVKGRGAVCLEGGDVVAVQLAYLSPERARSIAARGRVAFAVENMAVEAPVEDLEAPVSGGHMDMAAGFPTLRLVPDVGPVCLDKPAGAALRRGRPLSPDRAAVQMECVHCGHAWQTGAASVSKCSKCGKSKRVPQRTEGN